MSEPTPMVVKLDDLGDIVAAVPHLLGFEPTESLVAVALSEPRDRMSFSLRIDLPEGVDEIPEFADYVAAALKRAEATSALLCVFTDAEPGDRGMPWQELVDTVAEAAEMPMRDAVLVGAERIWSYLCADPGCCPPEGRVRDTSTRGATTLAAAHALLGNAVLPSRDDLVATVAPLGGVTAESMDQAMDRAFARYGDKGRQRFAKEVRATAASVLERYAEPPAQLDHDEAATLIIGLLNVELRDELLGRACHDHAAMRGLFTDLVRLATPPFDAPTCTVFAALAYLDGDGVLATTALERALDTHPDYNLARMFLELLQGQVPPTFFREALQVFEQDFSAGAAPARRRGTASRGAAGRATKSRSPGGAARPGTRRRDRRS